MNMMFRARHVVRGGSIEEKIGMTLHIIFSSLAKSVRDFGGTHVVVCLEGKSWRHSVYPQYKLARREMADERSVLEKEEDAHFFEAFKEFTDFLTDQTNCTVLQHGRCEADDFIARWIQNHPSDKHVIISSDSDFYQLINENVSQYNGITGQHITHTGIFNDRGKPIIDKKTKQQKHIGDPEYILFEKCIRGDKTDGIFSAYPGARVKGSKNKVGIQEAFQDRHRRGYEFNNFMLQRWTDHNDQEHVVLDDFKRNQLLIDLTMQPDDIKQCLDDTIMNAVQKPHVTNVGIKFMKFCGRYDLARLAQSPDQHAAYLNAKYISINEST